jgi:hypothetical protein
MHTAEVTAFLLFAAATVVSVVERAWVLALIAAGLCVLVFVPAFNIH